MKPKLPIGLQNLREMRTQGYVYVDKTAHVARLAEEGKYYFLARPRRFGKSLLVDTLAEAFAGSRELFEGLYLEQHWDWGRKYPVLRFDFGEGVLPDRALLDATLLDQLRLNSERYGLPWREEPVHLSLGRLVRNLREAAGQPVVLLVDEYDKPILDNLNEPDVARAMREVLKNFYSVLKGLDPHLKFVLLTGVSKFSKVSLFSGLNNLEDLTLDPRAATLCGYTQAELAGAFADYLDGVDLAEVRRWYNGYNFLGEPVYNPFDILLYLRHREFRPYWFETGTPTFLVELLRQRRFVIPEADDYWASEELLGAFEVDAIRTRGAAVPDRLRHRARAAGTPQRLLLPAGFSQPRSAGQPAPGGAAALRPQPARAAAGRRADVPGAGARRSRGSAPRLARLLRVHPPRLVPAQRPGRLRRLLGLAGLLPVRRPGGGDPGRGTWQSRPGGPGDRVSGPGVAAGIQGGRTGRRPAGAGANQGPGLPPPLRRPAGDPDRDGLQRGTAQPDRLRLGAGVSGPVSQNFCDPYKNASLYPISKRVVTQFHPIERRNPHGTPSITPPTLYILLILLSIFTLPAWAVLPTAGTWVTDQNKEFTISSSGVISGLTIAVWSS